MGPSPLLSENMPAVITYQPKDGGEFNRFPSSAILRNVPHKT